MKVTKRILCACLLLLCFSLGACAALGGGGDPCADGHRFTDWKVTQKESCGVAGEKTYTCDRCDATQSEVIPATGKHRLQDWFVVDTPATALEKGQRSRYCERCRLAVESVEIPAWRDTVPISATEQMRTLSLGACTVRYDISEQNGLYQEALQRFHAQLQARTGAQIAFLPYDGREGDGGFEILLGCGSAAQRAQALSSVEGAGFAVVAEENTLLILGTDALQTMRALQYFTYAHLWGKTGLQTLSVPARAAASHVPTTLLASEEGTAFSVVFSGRLDNDPQHKYVQSDEPVDSRDYPCVASAQFAEDLNTALLLPDAFLARNDKTQDGYEILIGTLPDHPEAESFRLTLEAEEYGVLVHGGKIILTAHNDVALEECLSQFLELLPLAAQADGSWRFPESFCAVGRVQNGWVTDFPKPAGEGIALYNSQYNNDNSLQFYYTGAGVNAAAFEAYCDTLLAAGYTVLSENGIEDSLFKTFVNRERGVTLYVAYNDYKYEERYATNDEYNVDYEKCIRVISAPLDSVTLPDAGLLTAAPRYEKITDSAVTALPFTGKAVGMGYVILLEDGRFVVIDGGGVNQSGREHEQLFDVLCAQFERAFGKAPNPADPIRIAAWINTHSHWDHYYAFQQMLKKHGPTGEVTLEYLIGNFPEISSIYPVSSSTSLMGKASTIATMQSYLPSGFQYVKVHTGQKFYLANLTVEILMTFEDHNPRRICNSNDTCTVVRMSFHNGDARDKLPVTAVFLADAFRFQSRYLCAMYGDYLKSDLVQLSHHGNIGCEKPVYEAISPTAVFFPNDYDSYRSYTQGESSKWNYQVDRFVTGKLESVRYVYVAHQVFLTLTLGENGPLYDEIYDAITQQPIAYNEHYILEKSVS